MGAQLKYYTIPPPRILADYVRHYWVVEGLISDRRPFVHRSLADCCAELIFYFKGRFERLTFGPLTARTFTSTVYGQTQQFYKFTTREDFGIFGVYLYPYAIPLLFGIEASNLSNQVIDLRSLCGRSGEVLEERILLSSKNTERARLISEFLVSRLGRLSERRSRVLNFLKCMIDSHSLTSIDALSRDFCLSRRQLERTVKELSGFNPKLLLRILRFNSVISMQAPDKSLTQVACDFGYYDQSHFIRDFVDFSGYSPKEFFEHAGEAKDHRATSDFKS